MEMAKRFTLRTVTVRGLFGARSAQVDCDPVLTILTGENGSGKSTILRAVDQVLRGAWRELQELPVAQVNLEFESGQQLMVETSDDRLRITSRDHGTWSPTKTAAMRDLDSTARRIEELDRRAGEIRRRGASTEELRRLHRERTALSRHWARRRSTMDDPYESAPDWLQELVEGTSSQLISARRLEQRVQADDPGAPDEISVPVVDQIADEVASIMRNELAESKAQSSERYRVLPSDIVRAMQEPDKEIVELANDVDALRDRVLGSAESLTGVGLLQDEQPNQQLVDYPRDNRQVLLAVREAYRAAETEYAQLEELGHRLGLLANFLDKRLSGKKVNLNRETGIAFQTEDGFSLRPGQLSSGEQQLVALAYDLLFATDKGSIVLIDEPEISLHVAWLQGLTGALEEIGEERDLQLVIATHSPSVLAGYSDMERSLDLQN